MRLVLFAGLAAAQIAIFAPAGAQDQTQTETPSLYAKTKDALATLSPLQRFVTQLNGTEPAFRNAFWDKKDPGLYVDVVSGEPLFASTHKYDSGSGWPSFVQPIEPANIVKVEDTSFGMTRVEVRSKHGDSHLGHVFTDGPAEAGGLRYCINSAALRFVAVDDLEVQGYGDYTYLFTSSRAPTETG